MKFKKVLSALALMAAFTVTACNGAASSEEPASEQPAATSQPAAKSSDKASSKAGTSAPASSSKASSSAAKSSSAPTTSQAPAHTHTWTDGAAVKNAEGKDVIPMTCACGKVGAKIAVNDFASAEFDSDDDNQPNSVRPSQKTNIVWNVVAPKAGKYTVTLDMFCAKNGSQKMSSRSFKVTVGDTEYDKYDYGDTTADDLGMTATVSVNVILAQGVNLVEGVNAIALSCAGYRLIYTNYLMIAEE